MKHLSCQLIILFLLIVFQPVENLAQYHLFFKSDHDISSSLIRQVLTDSKGMVWVVTEDGLNCFDGSKFKIFKHKDGNPNSLGSNSVLNVFEDSDGNLFVATSEGVQLFDYATDSFSPPGTKSDGNTPINRFSKIIQFSDGRVWATGRNVMNVKVTPQKTIVFESLDLPEEIELTSEIIEDGDGNIWMAKAADGTYMLDKKGKLKHYHGKVGMPIFISFALDSKGVLYGGAINGGVFRYDKIGDTFRNVIPQLEHVSIKNLNTSPDGKIMVCTDKDGFYEFDTETGELVLVNVAGINAEKAKVHSADYDKYGNLWMGIYQQGVIMKPPTSNEFHSMRSFSSNDGTCVSAICIDRDGIIWVGTDNDGIYKLTLDKKVVAHLTRDVPSIITGIMEDSHGNLWISTYGDGVGILDRATGKFKEHMIIDSKGYDVKHSFGMAKDKSGNIYVSTMGSGLFVVDANTGITHRDDRIDKNLLYIPSIYYSPRKNQMLVGAYDGINILNLADSKEFVTSMECAVFDIVEADDGSYWLATSTGLVNISDKGEILHTYSEKNGLPSSAVYSINQKDGILWMGTSAGLSRFDPKSVTFSNYSSVDGLQSNEFSRNAEFLASDGTLYFGGIRGLTYFKPEQIRSEAAKHSVRVTDFYVNGVSINTGMLSGGKPISDRPVYEEDSFSLSRGDNSFSIEFTSDNPKGSSQLEYWYAFDNGKWEKAELGNPLPMVGKGLINFIRVAPGKHTLQMKIVDNGVESEVKSINIEVRPAWYETWWAKLLFAILLALIIVVGVQYYLREQKRKRKEFEIAQNEQLNESRIQFLVNISHDIRTPMTLIMDPLKRLLASDSDPDLKKTHGMMLRNARRIMRMVNEVMDLRKLENGKMKMRFKEVKAVPFLDDVVELFRPSAISKGLTMSFEHEGCDDLTVAIDPEYFDKILLNLLSNAIKYTPEGGKISIRLSEEDGKAVIKVIDTGPGIPDSEKGKIFDRFYQAPNHAVGGSGIGLHITQALILLHNGDITVADNVEDGNGTVFTVTIPVHQEMSNNETPDNDNKEHRRALDSPDFADPQIYGDDDKEARKKGRKLIYVVEDDEEIKAYLKQELGLAYNVETFSNGKEALDAVFKKRPDLVISDIMMPEMDGIELTSAIKKNVQLNTLPVMLLTAKTANADSIEGFEAGADAYVVKPFDMDVLKTRAAALIGTYTRLRNAFNGNQTQDKFAQKVEVVSNDDRLMERMLRVINEHISDYELTVEDIAEKVGISRVHLYRKLKEITNQSPRDFIRNYRLQRAAELLAENKLNVAQICDIVGFSNPGTFSTSFKKLYGMSPSEYAISHKQTEG